MRNVKDILATINDSENRTYCKDSENIGFKRSAKPRKQHSQSENEEVFGFFQKRNYKEWVSLGLYYSVMNPFLAVLDTESTQNMMIYSLFIAPCWTNPIKLVKDPELRGPGVIILKFFIEDLRVRVFFGVADNFSVRSLLGTLFIDRFVKHILLYDQVVLPKHSKTVAIIATGKSKMGTVEDAKSDEKKTKL